MKPRNVLRNLQRRQWMFLCNRWMCYLSAFYRFCAQLNGQSAFTTCTTSFLICTLERPAVPVVGLETALEQAGVTRLFRSHSEVRKPIDFLN